MTIRKASLALAVAALAGAPAWAVAAAAPAGAEHGRGHGNAGAEHGRGHGRHGESRRCTPHSVGYVASGTLVSQALTKNAAGTYSGELTVVVARTNHHAAADKGKTVTYKVEDVAVTFGMRGAAGGPGSLEDVKASDRVRLIGRITTLVKKCATGEFTPTTTIRRITFHGPAGTRP